MTQHRVRGWYLAVLLAFVTAGACTGGDGSPASSPSGTSSTAPTPSTTAVVAETPPRVTLAQLGEDDPRILGANAAKVSLPPVSECSRKLEIDAAVEGGAIFFACEADDAGPPAPARHVPGISVDEAVRAVLVGPSAKERAAGFSGMEGSAPESLEVDSAWFGRTIVVNIRSADPGVRFFVTQTPDGMKQLATTIASVSGAAKVSLLFNNQVLCLVRQGCA